MTQFAQRIVVDFHLNPLSEEETGQCIRHRLKVAGGHPSLFTNKACVLVHRLTRGVPRLINQVCDIALTYGFTEQARVITSKLVALAAFDRIKGGILPLAAQEELSILPVLRKTPARSIPSPHDPARRNQNWKAHLRNSQPLVRAVPLTHSMQRELR